MHPTLLIGPADWSAEDMPREEFDNRISALWHEHPRAVGAIVYGDSYDHAALAYLTNFTTKLEPAVVLLSRHEGTRLLVGGGINMIPAARPLTWIEQLMPLRDLGKAAKDWSESLPGGGTIVIIGEDGAPATLRKPLIDALPLDRLEDGAATLLRSMRRKSPREIKAIRRGCGILVQVSDVLREAHERGHGATDVVIAAEHIAHSAGAQDVRSLFSLDCGRTFRPFEKAVDRAVDRLHVWFGICVQGYWVEAFMRAGSKPAMLSCLQTRLDDALTKIMPGALKNPVQTGLCHMMEGHQHPLSFPALLSIGLSLRDEDGDDSFNPGEVVSIRAGVRDMESGDIASALVWISKGGTEVLWRTP